jgi:hypothetical protein
MLALIIYIKCLGIPFLNTEKKTLQEKSILSIVKALNESIRNIPVIDVRSKVRSLTLDQDIPKCISSLSLYRWHIPA